MLPSVFLQFITFDNDVKEAWVSISISHGPRDHVPPGGIAIPEATASPMVGQLVVRCGSTVRVTGVNHEYVGSALLLKLWELRAHYDNALEWDMYHI